MSREAAARREVAHRAEVVLDKLELEPVDDPVSALMTVTSEVLAVKSWLADRFAEADAADQYMLCEMLGRSLDRASRLLVELHRLGLAEARARLSEQQARAVVDVVAAMLAELGVDPTAQHVRATVRRHLERVDAPGYWPQPPEHWRLVWQRQREATQQ